jgi:hypothetical protein
VKMTTQQIWINFKAAFHTWAFYILLTFIVGFISGVVFVDKTIKGKLKEATVVGAMIVDSKLYEVRAK